MTRTALVAHWMWRAASEARIGRGFGSLLPRLRAVGMPSVVVDGVSRAASDEQRHAELCVDLASRYAVGDPGSMRTLPLSTPQFGTTDERLELLYLLAGTCCINETLAVACIRGCLSLATDPWTRRANRAHLREEIGHSRVGWALLASDWLEPWMRRALAERLPRLLASNVHSHRRGELYVALEMELEFVRSARFGGDGKGAPLPPHDGGLLVAARRLVDGLEKNLPHFPNCCACAMSTDP